MFIKRIVNHEGNHSLDVNARMDETEFMRLHGCLNKLCVINAGAIKTPSTVIKTGARHAYAKYFLFPAKVRRLYSTVHYDYNNITCGTLESNGVLIITYCIKRRSLLPVDK